MGNLRIFYGLAKSYLNWYKPTLSDLVFLGINFPVYLIKKRSNNE